MQNYTQIKSVIAELQSQMDVYETKPTKAESKRIRASLTAIKKLVTPTKKELINADSAK